MIVDRTRLLSKNIKKLLRRGATDNLHNIINKTHTADLAGVFQFLSLSEQKAFFNLFDKVEQKAMLFSELEHEILLSLIESEPAEKVAEILEWMAGDYVADLLGKISDARAKALLDLMTKEGSKDVEELIGYDPKTAGGIMVVDFIALN
jgi:magnesium transporter